MRFSLVAVLLLTGVSSPALAQREPQDRRIERLEQELRAVQRRVFPGGQQQTVEPEIRPADPVAAPGGTTGNAILNLTGRVDAMEAQLRDLTRQVEEADYRNRQLEQQVTRLRGDLEGRIGRLEARPAPAEPAVEEQTQTPAAATPSSSEGSATSQAAAPARAADPAEAAYNAGFRLWEQRRYAEAQAALEQAATRHPRSRWASWARNLQGRALLDDNKPATAARVFLANYQENARGERAADSLFFLGEALTKLDRRTEACRVYDELAEVYPDMRAYLRQRLPAARQAARCAAAAAATR